MNHRITLIKGDGIGPEITDVAVKAIEAAGVKIDWDLVEAGQAAVDKYRTPLPDSTVSSIKKNKVALKGPITTSIGRGFRSVNVYLRKHLDLYACVRPCKNYDGVNSLYKGVDLVIIRENIEDLYAGIEFAEGDKKTRELIKFVEKISGNKIRGDSSVSLKPISITGSERIAEFAFTYAIENNRKKVTSVTKANIMKQSDGLFMKVAEAISKRYSNIKYEHILIDNLCAQLVQKPQQFDVLLMPNLYGDIVSDLCAGLVGGLGVAPGFNIGQKYAIFEAAHGSAPDIAGKNIANPTAILLSSVLMLRHINEKKAAEKLENALREVLKEGRMVTRDLNPKGVGTREMGEAVLEKLKKM